MFNHKFSFHFFATIRKVISAFRLRIVWRNIAFWPLPGNRKTLVIKVALLYSDYGTIAARISNGAKNCYFSIVTGTAMNLKWKYINLH